MPGRGCIVAVLLWRILIDWLKQDLICQRINCASSKLPSKRKSCRPDARFTIWLGELDHLINFPSPTNRYKLSSIDVFSIGSMTTGPKNGWVKLAIILSSWGSCISRTVNPSKIGFRSSDAVWNEFGRMQTTSNLAGISNSPKSLRHYKSPMIFTRSKCCRGWVRKLPMMLIATATWPNQFACIRIKRP